MRLAPLCVLLLSGCSILPWFGGDDEWGPPRSASEYRSMRADLVDELEDAIGEAKATDVSACRVIAVGEKACGGPAEYRIYSAADLNAVEVRNLAQDILQLDQYANEQFDLTSTCDVTPVPRPAVVEGRCVTSGW